MEFFLDFIAYLKKRNKYWLAPVIFILLLIGLLTVIAANSALAPFIYTLF